MTMDYVEGRRMFAIRRDYTISPESSVLLLVVLWVSRTQPFDLGGE